MANDNASMKTSILDKFSSFDTAKTAVEQLPASGVSPVNDLLTAIPSLTQKMDSVMKSASAIQSELDAYRANELDAAILLLTLQELSVPLNDLAAYIKTIAAPMKLYDLQPSVTRALNPMNDMMVRINTVYIPTSTPIEADRISAIVMPVTHLTLHCKWIRDYSGDPQYSSTASQCFDILDANLPAISASSSYQDLMTALVNCYGAILTLRDASRPLSQFVYTVISGKMANITSIMVQLKSDLVFHEYKTASVMSDTDAYKSDSSDLTDYFARIQSFMDYSFYSMSTFLKTGILSEADLLSYASNSLLYSQKFISDCQSTNRIITISIQELETFLNQKVGSLSNFAY